MIHPLNQSVRRRVVATAAVIVFVFFLFGLRLFQVQIVDGEEYANLAGRNTTTELTIAASRGEILDRNLNPIAVNRASYSVVFDYAFFPRGKDTEQQYQQNQIILSLTNLLEKAGEDWNDTLPISDSAPYSFEDDREGDIEKLKELLRMAEYATADNCMAELVKRYSLENYSAEEQRRIAGVRYEMEVREFALKNPFTFSDDVSAETTYQIKEHNTEYPGVDVQTTPVREYKNGDLASHLIGTVSPIYPEEYEELKAQGYALNDTIGRGGIEAAAENYLRGTAGTRTLVKNSKGTIIEDSITEEPVPGDSVVLTIDLELQQKIQEALDATIQDLKANGNGTNTTYNGKDVRSGAVVMLDAKNGGVLASASWPTFDLSTYNENYTALLNDPDQPLFNRALDGAFACGSTMKPGVALAALTEGVITPGYTYTCHKVYNRFSDYKPTCMGTHYTINVVTALAKSCNIFFYETGFQLGIEKMNAYSALYGLGQKTGIEVGEAEGVLAGPAEREAKGLVWNPGDTVSAAIGQSDNLFTPLQLATYCMTIANDGVRYKTHLIDSVRSYDGKTVTTIEPEIVAQADLTQEAIDTVRQGMIQAALSGTAQRSFGSNVPYTVACKTGTAEVSKTRSDHGVFIAYAPVEDPEIAVAVLLEDGTSAPSTALGRTVMDAYFELKEQRQQAADSSDGTDSGSAAAAADRQPVYLQAQTVTITILPDITVDVPRPRDCESL